jgi:hypothetical protein
MNGKGLPLGVAPVLLSANGLVFIRVLHHATEDFRGGRMNRRNE